MSRTARLSEDAHRKVKRLAEERDMTVAEVLDEIVHGELADLDIDLSEPVIGYCPVDGFEFRERHRKTTLLGPKPGRVECPVPSHTGSGKLNCSELLETPPEHVDGPITSEDLDDDQT